MTDELNPSCMPPSDALNPSILKPGSPAETESQPAAPALEELKRPTVPASGYSFIVSTNTAILQATTNYSISFADSTGKQVGKLTWDKELHFEGNADESAIEFVRAMGNAMSQKMMDYEAALRLHSRAEDPGGTKAIEALEKWSNS